MLEGGPKRFGLVRPPNFPSFKGLDAMSSRLRRGGAVVRAADDSKSRRPVVIRAGAAGELEWPATPACW